MPRLSGRVGRRCACAGLKPFDAFGLVLFCSGLPRGAHMVNCARRAVLAAAVAAIWGAGVLAQQAPGLRGSFSQNGLNYCMDVAIGMIEQKFATVTASSCSSAAADAALRVTPRCRPPPPRSSPTFRLTRTRSVARFRPFNATHSLWGPPPSRRSRARG